MSIQNINPLDGSHFAQELGMRLLSWSDGQASLELEVTQRLANRLGMAHGGVVCALLDQVMGLAWRSVGTDRIPGGTINLNINFIAPANGLLLAQGKLIRFTKSSAFCEGNVLDQSGHVIATGQAVFSARIGVISPVSN
jgi:uncharacterized protein (TIGR00369 family)